jgi:hypothetical protein
MLWQILARSVEGPSRVRTLARSGSCGPRAENGDPGQFEDLPLMGRPPDPCGDPWSAGLDLPDWSPALPTATSGATHLIAEE